MLILNENYSNFSNLLSKGMGSNIFAKKKYFDLSSGGGCQILGHNNKIFKDSLRLFLKNEYSNFSAPNLHANRFAESLSKLYPQFEKFIFCNSGAEANIKALRICRALTKKDLVASVAGSWHGSVDQFLFQSNKKLKPIPISEGLVSGYKNKIIFLPFNKFSKTKQILNKFKSKLSCVFFEPIQGCLPSPESEKYYNFLRNECIKKKIPLVLDEIVTGLRINGDSFQNKLNNYSDLATFGKCFGNSLPISFIGISKKIYKKIKKNKIKLYFGGTYSGNSLSTYVANKNLIFLKKNKTKIIDKINNIAKNFSLRISKFINNQSIDAKIYYYESIMRIVFSNKYIDSRVQRDFLEKKNLTRLLRFKKFLWNKGIYYPSNGIIFFSYSMKEKDLENAFNLISLGLKKFFSK